MEEELKLQIMDASASVWNRIARHPLLAIDTGSAPLLLHAFYYDGRDKSLQRARLAYRIRREGDAWIATLKASGESAGGLHQRPEWNVAVANNLPDLSVFKDPEAAALVAPFLELPLQVILETKFERYESRIVRADASVILVALDRGEILAQGLREAIREVELELVTGRAASILEMGAELCQDLPLLPDNESKMFRGLRLAGLLNSENHGKREPAFVLRRRESAGIAFSQLLTVQLQQIIHAARIHWAGPAAENFHHLRKEVRALRALLRFCRGMDSENHLQPFRLALQEWYQQQNPRRDHDALLGYWTEIAASMAMDPTPLEQVLEKQAPKQSEQLHALVAILLRLWAFLSITPLQDTQTLQLYAESHLRREDRKLMAAGKLFTDQPDTFHSLRIRIKNMRSVSLAMATLWPGKDSKSLLKLLSALQGIAGEIHDADMAGSYLEKLAGNRKADIAFHAGVLLGYLQGRKGRQRKKFEKFWARLESASRPWD